MEKIIKQLLPKFVVSLLSGSVIYIKRAKIWLHVILNAKGVSKKDKQILRKSFSRAPIQMFAELDKWQYPTLTHDADLHIKNNGIFSVRAHSDDLFHVFPKMNASIVACFDKLLKSGDNAIDAGANIGGLTVCMANKVSSTGTVIAVEMMPDTANILRRNLAHNEIHWAEVVENALSNTPEEVLEAKVLEGYFGQASIVANIKSKQKYKNVKVKTTTIDSITDKLDVIALIKFDVEGAELQALEGAVNTLKRTKAVIFESWESDGGDAAKFLIAHGFTISEIDPRNFLAKGTA